MIISKNNLKRAITVGLVAMLLTNSFPAAAFAAEVDGTDLAVVLDTEPPKSGEEITEEKTEGASDKEPSGEEIDSMGDAVSPSTVPSSDNPDEDDKKDSKAERQEYPAFGESAVINGVKITVTADPGVFPKGTELSVKRAGYADRKQAQEAVEDARDEKQNVAVSYTFDIKILDEDGNEIEPADEGKVKVSFTLDEVADENLETNVYHITEKEESSASEDTAETQGESELTAEKLPVEIGGDTVVAETDGFSLYTVEFSYENLQYVMEGDSSIALSEILDTVGLTGEVSEVEVSNTSLFSADKENGEWVVTAHKAFSSKEWMKVTINDVVYEIAVTDTSTSTLNVGGTNYTLFTGFTATGGNGTNYANLVDGNTSSDWIATKNFDDPNAPANDFAGGTADPAFVEFHADEAFIPKGYVLTCVHENAGFWKPLEWALKAKLNEGDGWTTIHSSTTTLGQGKTFEIACDNDGDNEYQYFRFEVYEVGTTMVVDLDELQFYGSLPAYTHLTVKAATCMATGIKVDCYRRNSDGKYFTDNTGTTELAESDVIAPIIPHTGVHHDATDTHIKYWQCSMCGKYFSDEGCATEITEEQTKIYRTITIDNSISGLVEVAFSKTQALAGESIILYVDYQVDASTLKVNDGAVELTAKTDIQYTFTMPAADVTVTADVAQSNADGDVLTGSIRHTVTIPDGASITLSNATITGGIVCNGTATIILVGTNSVSGATNKAGIQIGGSGTTLTINGDGTLTANGGDNSAGIGLSRAWNVTEDVVGGNIVINGGNITANGGGGGAGIGAGVTKDTNNSSSRKAIVGTITIAGGSVTAVGGSNADGIGAGKNDYNATIQIGTVTIYDGIDKVDASSIKDFASVVYMHGETNVTASKANYFNIVEDGNRRIITPSHTHNFTYSATGATITATCSNDCPLTDHKATLTIAAPTGDLTYDGTAKAATISGDTTVLGTPEINYQKKTGASTWGDVTTTAPTDAGTYKASITLGTGTGAAASVEYTISPKEVSLTWANTSFTYDGTEHCPVATAGDLIVGDTCTVTVTGGKTNAGDYTATASELSDSNYKLPTNKTRAFTIAKADIDSSAITAPTKIGSLVYDGSAQALVNAGSATGGTMQYAIGADATNAPTTGWSTAIPTGTEAKTYYVWYKVKGDNNHNDTTPASLTVDICKWAVTVTAKDQSVEVNDIIATGVSQAALSNAVTGHILGDVTLTPSSTSSLTENGTITPSAAVIKDASGNPVTDNYSITYTAGTLVVTMPQVYISGITAKSKVYDKTSAAELTGTPVLKRVKNDETVNGLTVSGYTAAFADYNAGNNKTVTISGGTLGGTNASGYTLMIDKTNEKLSLKANITPKEVSLEWGDTSFAYDGNIHCPAASAGELIEGDSCTVTVTGEKRDAGSYTATAESLSNSNYKLPANSTKSFKISKAESSVGTAPVAKTGLVYNGKPQALVSLGTAEGGAMNYALGTETAASGAYSEAIPAPIDAGTYHVWYKVRGDKNHNDSAEGKIDATIAKAFHADIELSDEVRYGRSKTIDLASYIEDDGRLGTITKEDSARVLSPDPSLNGSILEFSANDNKAHIGKSAKLTIPVEGAKNYNTYNIILTVNIVEKYSQEIKFAETAVTLKNGESYTNTLTGAMTPVTYKSSDEAVASVDGTGKVTALSKGTATITASAEETEDYFGAEATYTVNVEDDTPNKVPVKNSGESYASSEDNFAPVTSSGKINGMVLDFSNVAASKVDPSLLSMTVINGSKFTTAAKVKDKNSVRTTGGVKAKVNKKTLIPKITCKKNGTATFTMEDGSTYTVTFRVEKPKAQKAAKSLSKGGSAVTKTIKELFGTDIDAGELKIMKQKHSQATLSGNSLIVDPKEKDSIKVQYKYLNKKYKLTMKVK